MRQKKATDPVNTREYTSGSLQVWSTIQGRTRTGSSTATNGSDQEPAQTQTYTHNHQTNHHYTGVGDRV